MLSSRYSWSSWSLSCAIAASPINHLQSCSRCTKYEKYAGIVCVSRWLSDSDEIKLHSMATNKSKNPVSVAHDAHWCQRTLSVLAHTLSVCLLHFIPSQRRMPMVVCIIFFSNFNFISPQKWDSLSFGRPRPTNHSHTHRCDRWQNRIISNGELPMNIFLYSRPNVPRAAVDVRIRISFSGNRKKKIPRWSNAQVVTLTSDCTLNRRWRSEPQHTDSDRKTIAI